MANPDSFIDEVTEEVRRDRLYGLVRRWGWVAVLAVLLIVGGAAWTEWRAAQARDAAARFGDAILAASQLQDPGARAEAVADVVPVTDGQAAIAALLTAATRLEAEQSPEAAASLLSLADAAEVPLRYRHLALLKLSLNGGTGDAVRDASILEELAAPGAPFRPLALEQQALAALQAGDEATAVTLLRLLTQEAGVSDALRRRALQVIVALGASAEPV
ncbi:tetratricopeptide repeat protein [Jannaschia sp. LMIT008]|uniref:tetratricopeptide repeat protein n=1 Tax=Jannaschia maritima TaxID=3032585 RepID=UPI0028126378|nr:tetratricopeptide repeat protein [Jannaschia sp. LMIT008]